MFTVLVVDDTPESLMVLGSVLQPHYRVRAANSGARALQVAKTEPRPDIILLDIMMPDMDGYAVLERLRADPDMHSIPVIFVTAMDSVGDEERGLSLGAVDYITARLRRSAGAATCEKSQVRGNAHAAFHRHDRQIGAVARHRQGGHS